MESKKTTWDGVYSEMEICIKYLRHIPNFPFFIYLIVKVHKLWTKSNKVSD